MVGTLALCPPCWFKVERLATSLDVHRMSVPELQVVYRTDEDWTGEIIATVKSGGFSARGSAWFDRGHVAKTFLSGLRSFPLTSINPPLIEGGFWSSGDPAIL